MTKFDKNNYVTTARFDGQGRGHVFGFNSLKAAHLFAHYVLFGFAEVYTWDAFFRKYPNYFD